MPTDEQQQPPHDATTNPQGDTPTGGPDNAPGAQEVRPIEAPAAGTEPQPVSPQPATPPPTAPVAPAATAETAPTPSVAETLAAAGMAPAEAAPAQPVAPTEETPTDSQPAAEPGASAPAATTAPADSAPEAPAEQASTEQSTKTLREKLASRNSEKPVGNVDLQTQRPEIPTNIQPVDLPENDDLDAALEAEIASALGDDEAASTAPPAAAVVPAETADGEAVAAPAKAEAEEEVGLGSKITGPVQHIHGDDIFINAGLRSDVVVSSKQFAPDKQPKVGDSLTVIVDDIDDDGLFRARLPTAKSKTGGNWDGLAVGQVVDCMVTATNKGGLQVTVSNLKGFLPASQVDLGYVASLDQYVGQKLTVQITEVKPKKRNLVVSRRAILEAERKEQQAGFWETLEVGQDYEGTVKTLKNYGAFVNLGPIDGFLHVGEISWSRINHPNEVLKEGQQIQVRVLKVDKEKSRISLGMKQLVQNPWMGLNEKYPSERVVPGKVTRITDFGAFIELEPGVEGLVHISELAWRRVGSVGEVLKVGDEKEFKVLEVDPKRKRVSLSLKALEQKPESIRKAEAEEEVRPVRKPNPDLRGGMGGSKDGGGMFGNPSDFT